MLEALVCLGEKAGASNFPRRMKENKHRMPRPVTSAEFSAVEIASKGETTTIRRWPREIVEVWLAEDVVRTVPRGPARREVRPALFGVFIGDFMNAVCVRPATVAAFFSRRT